MPMIAMTTKSSTSVKPARRRAFPILSIVGGFLFNVVIVPQRREKASRDAIKVAADGNTHAKIAGVCHGAN
jgi:hypothetical protein